MTSPEYDADETVVAAGGSVYVAPVGTARPVTLDADPASPWVNVGYISEDGATFTPAMESTDFNAWQKQAFRSKSAGQTYQWSFAMLEIDPENLKLAFGGGTTVVEGEDVIYTPPETSEEYQRAVIIDAVDGERRYRFYIPDAAVVDLAETTFNATSLTTLPVTIQAQSTGDEPPFEFIFPFASAAALATGATAGTPGSFTPGGSTIPADLAALQGASPAIVASPSTAWTTGQYVDLGDASDAYWTGTDWDAGMAP